MNTISTMLEALKNVEDYLIGSRQCAPLLNAVTAAIAAGEAELKREPDAAKEKIDTLWIQSADRATKIEKLTAENAALKEGLDGWHARCLDMEVERDALAQNAERVRVYKQRYFGAIAERDALAGEKHD